VAVVFGGRSSEHAVSCVSAGSVLAALDPKLFDVTPVGITQEGRWVLPSGDRAELEIRDRALPAVKDGTAVALPGDPTAGGLVSLEPGQGAAQLSGVDVVFPVLHGPFGEDGTIQGMLEMAGVPYVGPGVLTSAVCMDKEFTKKLLVAAGLPIGDYVVLRAGQRLSAAEQERLGLPVFVKPARAGSSFGVSKVSSWDQLDEAMAAAREIDPKVLVEAAIIGREVECGVLESETPGGLPDVSVLAQVRVVRGHEWYDFEAKYLDDACEFDVPAKLSDEVTAQVREYARQAFLAVDGSSLARVDFFLDSEDRVYVNEINTMPGFTPTSVFPRVWAATGLPYRELVSRLVATAARRGTGLH
jgi:D-alanine-D-alanine ligase